MKKIKYLFIMLMLVLSCFITGCSASTQFIVDDMYDGISYSTVVTYGTPYYIDNVLSYYLYRGMYYYPYYLDGIMYFHPYRHIQPHGFVFRPEPGFRPDMRFRQPMMRNNSPRQPMNRDMRPGNSHGNNFDMRSTRVMPQQRQSAPTRTMPSNSGRMGGSSMSMPNRSFSPGGSGRMGGGMPSGGMRVGRGR